MTPHTIMAVVAPPRKTDVFTIRATPEDRRAIQAAADAAGISLGAYMVRAALREAEASDVTTGELAVRMRELERRLADIERAQVRR